MKFPRVLLACALALPVVADEGMWLFNQFPKDAVKKAYTLDVADTFLDDLRLASVRIGGSSGSFVSGGGLVLTHRGAVADCIAKLSTADHDYVKQGFYAAQQSAELTCPGLEADVLVGMEEVTSQVKEGEKPAADDKKKSSASAETLNKRNAAIARLEKNCGDKTGNVCSVVKLSSGERYDLYQYKKYRDMRLVFAPERAMAFFGGDAATFTYQRYELDIAFLRAYESGKTAATPHYLKWSAEEAREKLIGDEATNPGPLFVVGSPEATQRLATSSQLTFNRDTALPSIVSRLGVRINALSAFVPKSDESRRIASNELSALGVAYKYNAGLLIGLRDERVLIRKINFEKRLRTAVEHDPKLGMAGGKVWDDVAAAYHEWAPSEKQYQILEQPAAEGSALFAIARQVLRLSQERAKPNEQRLPEYRDSALPSLEASLYAPAPIDDGLETAMIAVYLDELKTFGEKELPLKTVLTGKNSQQAAEELVRTSKLKDPAERKRLAADRNAAMQSDDGLMRLVRAVDDPARKLLKRHNEAIVSLDTSAAERIAQYRFRLFGAADYPDASSTPRISFGVVKAYKDRTEAPVTYATTFGGLYHLAGGDDAHQLPQRWMDAKSSINMVAPFDFVTTCDISTGDSGSPTVNQKGELVGMVFDANLEALPSTFMYTDEVARAVHVSTQGMVEALRSVYKAGELLKELAVPEKAVQTAADERR